MNEADEKLAIELVDLHAGISGSGLFVWNRSDVLAVAREAIRLTRERTMEKASGVVKSNMDALAALKNGAGNCDLGRGLQKGVWAMFAVEQELHRLSMEGK